MLLYVCGLTYFYVWELIYQNSVTLAFRTSYVKQRQKTDRKSSHMWLKNTLGKSNLCEDKCQGCHRGKLSVVGYFHPVANPKNV